MAPQSYLRNDVSFYEAGIGPRPINGGLDPGFEQDLWMDRLTLGGFIGQWILWRKVRHRTADPVRVRPDGRAESGRAAVRLIRVATRSRFRGPHIKPQIAWGSGPHYGKFSVGIVAPWGTHDDSTVVSAGRHYWSFDPSFSHTYLSESGWDVSTTVGFMINLENSLPGPNYESGDEAHIDALIGKHIGENFALGVAGYWYHQLTDDKGPIPRPLELGYQGDSTGYGPVIMFGNKNVSVVAKWIYENYADNRLRGDLYLLSFVARFGGEPPPPPIPVAPPPVARVEPPPPPPPPADADGDGVPDLSDLCPATPSGQRADVNGCSCDFTVQVHFRSNSTEITGADAITLDSLADQVRKLPTISGELGGHSDSQGPEAVQCRLVTTPGVGCP